MNLHVNFQKKVLNRHSDIQNKKKYINHAIAKYELRFYGHQTAAAISKMDDR